MDRRDRTLWAAAVLSFLVAIPLAAPAISAAPPAPAADQLSLDVALLAEINSPTLSMSTRATGLVELTGDPSVPGSFSMAVPVDLVSEVAYLGRSDVCSSTASAVLTASVQVDAFPDRRYPAAGQLILDLRMDPAVSYCTLIDLDIVLDFQARTESGFRFDPSTDQVVVESASTWETRIVARDATSGAVLGGSAAASVLRTRTVTDPSDPDKTGRVKVQFHWDTQQTSTWIRMAQTHAGGSMILPRMNWEVAVGDVSLFGTSERQDTLRYELPAPPVGRGEISFEGRATETVELLAKGLVRHGSAVTADGAWAGEVATGEGGVPGDAAFADTHRLLDQRHPPRFAPVAGHESERVGNLGTALGQDLAGAAPSVQFRAAVEAPSPSPVGLAIRQGLRLDVTQARWPDFEIHLSSYVSVQVRTEAADPAVRLEATSELTILGDEISRSAHSQVRHRFFSIVDRTVLPPLVIEGESLRGAPVVIEPLQGGPPRIRGTVSSAENLTFRISERSRVFATWTTVGFFQVSEDRFSVGAFGSTRITGIVDTPDVPQRVVLDLMEAHSVDGKKYKPLFAVYIAELDGKVNMAIGARRVEAQTGVRCCGFTPGGLFELRPTLDVVVTTPADRFVVPTDPVAVGRIDGDAFLLDFAGTTVE